MPSSQMDPLQFIDWKTLAVAAVTLCMFLVSWAVARLTREVGLQGRRIDAQGEKIAALDKASITRAELHSELEFIRTDLAQRHSENRKYFDDISRKIDANEARNATTRHRIANAVNTLVLNMAVMQTRLGISPLKGSAQSENDPGSTPAAPDVPDE